MTEPRPEDKELLDKILQQVQHFEETLGVHYRDGLWARMDRLYHGWTQLRSALSGTRDRDRDDIINDARKEFGHELHIPHAFAIVETVLPALLSNRPRILVVPKGQATPRNVENMKAMIDDQQSNITLELRLQSVVKSGLQYGLGVGKSYWLRQEGKREKQVELASWHPARAFGKTHTVVTCPEPLFDDPTFEPIDPRKFGWDTFASNIDSARCAWHAEFRDPAYVRARLESGVWGHQPLKPEDIESSNGSADRYRKVVQGPFEAQGIPVPNPQGARDSDIHEVIEYHDRARIITVLDRRWIVNIIENKTNYGRLPFHVYRPTEVLNQFVGKGEIEPIEDLQREMDMIRTDRRWSAAVTLNPPLFYNDGMIEPDKIRVGPGELNAVNGDPKDIIWQMDLRDVPNSSWRETAEIAQDIVRASGISDTFAGGDAGSAATATGVQLQMARASARIQLKTLRAEKELIKPIGRHWGRLNQRHIIEQRDVQIPAPPVPGEPERRWAQVKLGPNELAGEFDYDVDGGSTTPVNEPQMRQDAQFYATLMSGPMGAMFDPRQMAITILEKMGEKNPEAKLQAGMTVPPETLDVIAGHIAELGIDPNVARQIVEASLHEVMEAKDAEAQAASHGEGQGPPQQDQQQAA